jgi:hypothetical protein
LSSCRAATTTEPPHARWREGEQGCCALDERVFEHWLAHLANSRRTFLKLVQKARTFDEKQAQALIKDRNYAALDQMVLEHLMGK